LQEIRGDESSYEEDMAEAQEGANILVSLLLNIVFVFTANVLLCRRFKVS
jgi:hypothetical protein